MSGRRRFLLDTNAVVSLLTGNHQLARHLDDAEYVGISIITLLELLAFNGLSEGDRACFADFSERVDVVGLNSEDAGLIKLTLDLRCFHRLKFPDAIIGATALFRNATLISNDSHFDGIPILFTERC